MLSFPLNPSSQSSVTQMLSSRLLKNFRPEKKDGYELCHATSSICAVTASGDHQTVFYDRRDLSHRMWPGEIFLQVNLDDINDDEQRKRSHKTQEWACSWVSSLPIFILVAWCEPCPADSHLSMFRFFTLFDVKIIYTLLKQTIIGGKTLQALNHGCSSS